ncbi:response regulator [Clostridium saccharobutylicum]|uniref:Stage 0 sporulation protein A homolog n=1 Tax=Clostridium saccharobutylicum DSM 13864 TaxID=1345695 RepID=U5MTQ6_CLOSA|nr:response regulator [Clostridium saccharobutylicum]AGX43041.1 chemotaxis protein CheY [Clostridium saccharobutylicum DSM 13864]AQR90332.1 chemotaxis protein CheY [Clostridium saccharobutylicum]AQS00238.1 chemotaxis protein CheY [Clostridium saccharobutylicum]AQS10037.1 chemotaxis protein CheY [Clostridium saccharobutylicum]AQS14221.1 chemotaxis protein CheY [Clostridium saccharobutylicum]
MKKVLIVDDAVYMRLSLRDILERNGFEVIGDAVNGIDAINKYKMLIPDIVTMDITMPEMDGVKALQEIKKLDPNAKVVIISAMGQESIVREAIMNGAKGFIIKPFKEEKVIQSLSKI